MTLGKKENFLEAALVARKRRAIGIYIPSGQSLLFYFSIFLTLSPKGSVPFFGRTRIGRLFLWTLKCRGKIFWSGLCSQCSRWDRLSGSFKVSYSQYIILNKKNIFALEPYFYLSDLLTN